VSREVIEAFPTRRAEIEAAMKAQRLEATRDDRVKVNLWNLRCDPGVIGIVSTLETDYKVIGKGGIDGK